MPIIYHLLLAFLLLCIIIYATLKFLNVYTKHNEAVIVPDIKGLQMEKAIHFLENNGLRYHVIDSIHTKDVRPGAIVEVFPTVGSKVKEGRIIAITLNAKNIQKASIPDVKDLSFRQALALVQAQGFNSIETKYVAGKYRDLVIGVELNGKLLKPGEQVPLTSSLLIIVSDGGHVFDDTDSISMHSETNQAIRKSEN